MAQNVPIEINSSCGFYSNKYDSFFNRAETDFYKNLSAIVKNYKLYKSFLLNVLELDVLKSAQTSTHLKTNLVCSVRLKRE